MIKSMTAFAEKALSTTELSVNTEIRGYNSRSLDIVIRIPTAYREFEEDVRRIISNQTTRGRVEIRITILPVGENADAFTVNEQMATAYYDTLVRLKNSINPNLDIPFSVLAEKSGIIEPAEAKTDLDAAWPVVNECLTQALGDFETMRVNEGNAISADLKQRLAFIEDCIRRIEKNTEGLLRHYQEKLKARINELTLGMVDLDPGRIAQEAAFLADKSDISEEIVRARSHLAQLRQLMEAEAPAGRPINFLLQEFIREFNTMGNKACDAEISHTIVSAKTEIEKMREQIQNVE
jgi:uncharacterized protein (TIGR00255 family)